MRLSVSSLGFAALFLVATACTVQAAKPLTDDDLSAVRGAAGPPPGQWTCYSRPCAPSSCGWVEGRSLCVQVDNGGHPTATCEANGVEAICCSDEASDCYREKTLTPVDPGNCNWACNNPNSDNWSAWSAFMGARRIHCRYSNCP